MKKILLLTLITLIVISGFGITCFAEETADTGPLDEAFGGLEEAFSSLEIDWESLKTYALENKDDIVSVILVIVMVIMRSIVNKIVKNISPKVSQQVEGVAVLAQQMIDHENTVAEDNRTWRAASDAILDKIQEKLDNAEERDKLLTRATLALEASDKRYTEMTKILAEAFLTQATTNYDALMSAKLTDIRKAEIEENYLKQKKAYALMCDLCTAEVDKEESAVIETKEVNECEETLVA